MFVIGRYLPNFTEVVAYLNCTYPLANYVFEFYFFSGCKTVQQNYLPKVQRLLILTIYVHVYQRFSQSLVFCLCLDRHVDKCVVLSESSI